jgi:hypothetical protein
MKLRVTSMGPSDAMSPPPSCTHTYQAIGMTRSAPSPGAALTAVMVLGVRAGDRDRELRPAAGVLRFIVKEALRRAPAVHHRRVDAP